MATIIIMMVNGDDVDSYDNDDVIMMLIVTRVIR